MMENSNLCSGRVFCITGGSGFIGRNLARYLLNIGHKVVALDNFENSTRKDIDEFLDHKNYNFIFCDITKDLEKLKDAIAFSDCVIHLAASVGVQNATNNPASMLHSNLIGSLNVLNICAKFRKLVLVSSSSEVYGWSPKKPFREHCELVVPQPSNTRFSYALSKIVEEFYGIGLIKESNLPFIAFRLFNSIGPGQNNNHGLVVPNLIDQALKGEPLTVYGDGNQTRCFCDVMETVDAIYRLTLCPEFIGQTYNIGNNKPTKIFELARMIKDISGANSKLVLQPYDLIFSDGFTDMHERIPDITKIKEAIEWEPVIELLDILTRIIDYERSVRQKK